MVFVGNSSSVTELLFYKPLCIKVVVFFPIKHLEL